MSQKYIYKFSEGSGSMKELLGGKGANLAEMTGLGMAVPQGFTITTEACTRYYADGEVIAPEIESEIMANIDALEALTGKKFGDVANPLLVSVRSGARASMPGMMDTVLNLGLTAETTESLAQSSGNPRWAYDCYRRFIQMYSDVVMEVGKKHFEELIDEMKAARGVSEDVDLSPDDLKELAAQFKSEYKAAVGEEFPTDARAQLLSAVKAVFRSWNNERAIIYRRENDIPSSWGTAVNIQSMVFGNIGDDSGTGVAFTRDPSTGEKRLYGEFLINAQGEDVVAGIRTPQTIDQLAQVMPEVYNDFVSVAQKLDAHYRDMQDMEFTIERGKLYMLQTRNGKRTPFAAMKIAADLVAEGIRTEQEALLQIEPRSLDALLHPTFVAKALAAATPVANGLGASPGAACGAIYLNAEDAVKHAVNGPVLLVRELTSPEDLAGMYAAAGILTAVGGRTSHAAVVARGAGICCVVGCKSLTIDEAGHKITIGGTVVNEGEFISIDGTTGNVYIGKIESEEAKISGDFNTVMAWADKYRRLKVRTNADTPRDAAKAREFGAEGIGLCRTEHMFFEADRIPAIREMIVAETVAERERALAKLEPMQQGDFEGIYEAMEGLPVTIRFLDPPLHEFLPTETADIAHLAADLGKSIDEIHKLINDLHELNPMMGHRGCRLAVTYPEIAVMQTNAVIKAAIAVKTRHPDWALVPEIMIPLIGDSNEFRFVKKYVKDTADALIAASGITLDYKIGTMMEIPRACLTADEIAADAEFFSFGTNDLTQMTFGFSRDDAGKFLDSYYKTKIFESDPFARLDQNGVGKLVEMGVKLGRSACADLKIGICGEHGGDPSSVEFCHRTGLDYVSCSPFRVPIARLSAAQAAIKGE